MFEAKKQCFRGILRPLLLAHLLALTATAAGAHQLGKIQVYTTFLKDGTYQIDVPLDPSHMTPEDLGGAVGTTKYGDIPGLKPAADHGFGKLMRAFVDGATLAFDGREVEPELAIAPLDPDGPPDRVTLRLQGPIPGGARMFTWKNTIKIGSYPLVLKNEGDESSVWQWLEAGDASKPFPLAKSVIPPARGEVMRRYLRLGFNTILPRGPEPILFVLGLLLVAGRPRTIALQIAAFIVAHSLTLALGAYGVVRLSPAVVEPLLALSIVVVALANLLAPGLRATRLALVAGFGLLYGLAFAGALAEIGLPRAGRLTALLSFNLGLEGGQLAVIAAALLLVGLPFRRQAWYRQRVVVPASCVIAAVGLYGAVGRVFF
jgi:hypothetical protein